MPIIVGIDEVGRGCLAGPLVAGAVILDTQQTTELLSLGLLKDSKLLSKIQRTKSDSYIRLQSPHIGVGWVSPTEIDEIGLTKAVSLAMERALLHITINYDQVIIDGNYNFLSHIPKTSTLIKADNLLPSVSAASIIAKVARDNYMAEMSVLYPEYGFENHVGYGTKYHLEKLNTYGPSAIHRMSFKPLAIEP